MAELPKGPSVLQSKLATAQKAIAEVTGAAAPDPAAAMRARQAMNAQQRPAPVVPKVLSPAHVLFKGHKLNLGVQYTDNKTLRFVEGYFQTDDKDEIEYLKKYADHFGVVQVTTKA